MAVKIIPRRINPGDNVNAELEALIRGFPNSLVKEAINYIELRDNITEIQIAQIRLKNRHIKEKYIQDLLKTYEAFMQEIIVSQAGDNKQLRLQIAGEYDDTNIEPNIEYWGRCNPGKMTAIMQIMTDLKVNGWEPDITGVSPVEIDGKTGKYHGGGLLIITCDFTD